MRREQRAANVQKMKRKPSRIEVQIDEVVLHGFSNIDRYAIGDALSSELGQLVNDSVSNTFDQGIDLPSYRAREIWLPPQARPDTIGANVAQTVYAGLTAIHQEGLP